MRNNTMNNIFWIVLILMFTSNCQSTDFYVCDCQADSAIDCLVGDDDNDGSLANPFQSIAKANETFNSLSAGESIQFCQGGTWMTSSNLRWVNRTCQEDNRCTITDYTPNWATGDESKPILNFENGVNGISFSDSGNAEHEEGYSLENLDLRGSDGGNGVFIANDVDDVTITNLSISHFIIGVHVAGSQACNPIDSSCDGKNDRIILKDSTVTFNFAQGWLGGSDDTHIINNYFSDNGTRAVFDHNIY